MAVAVLLLLCSGCSSKTNGDKQTGDATPLKASTEDAGGKDTEQKNEENEMTEKIKGLKDLIKTVQKESIEEMWLTDLDEIEKEF